MTIVISAVTMTKKRITNDFILMKLDYLIAACPTGFVFDILCLYDGNERWLIDLCQHQQRFEGQRQHISHVERWSNGRVDSTEWVVLLAYSRVNIKIQG